LSCQSFGSKRETEIQSVEKLPETRRDEVAGSSKKIEQQNMSYDDGVNTKVDASKDSDGKELHNFMLTCATLSVS
jgi:pseudo-response regulator 5